MCARCVQDVCKVCARFVQDVCKMCARCAQDVRKVCARCVQDYSTCWVLEKSEEPCRILKKFVHACVDNVIHAKVLPVSVLYIEH